MKYEFVADFETTSIKRYKTVKLKKQRVSILDRKNSEAFVCAWAIAPLNATSKDDVKTGRTIQSFMSYCVTLTENLKKRDSVHVFTHNLKFDGAFILYEVLKGSGYQIENEIRDDALYSFDVIFDSKTRITFRDSNKIFTCGVKKLGELYGIPKLLGEWNYEKYRDENTFISDEEWDYVKHDVLIVCKALKDYRDRGYTQNTAASIAYNQRLAFTYPWFKKSYANTNKHRDYEKFRNAFPDEIKPLTRDVHIELLNAYFGGCVWLNPHYAGVLLRNVTSFDENSMYPDKMANGVLPVGQPYIYDNPDKRTIRNIQKYNQCYVYRLSNLSIKLKDEWSIPMLMFETDPKTSVRCQGKIIECQNEIAWLTNYDYTMMCNEYNVTSCTIERIFVFEERVGQYKDYVDYWMKVKAEHTILKKECEKNGDCAGVAYHEQQRAIAKLMLNSPYGKDGTKLWRTKKTSYIDNDGLLSEKAEIEETVIEYYLPSAIFICALARYDLYTFIKAAGRDFIYCDTDSGKMLQKGAEAIYEAYKAGKVVIDDSALGAWKNEGCYDEAVFVRQKTYAVYDKGSWHYTVCGAPDSVKQAFDIKDFKRGMVLSLDDIHKCTDPETGQPLQGKLIPVPVKGGVILQEVPFQINDIEDWAQFTPDNLPIDRFVDYMRGVNVNGKKCKEGGYTAE